MNKATKTVEKKAKKKLLFISLTATPLILIAISLIFIFSTMVTTAEETMIALTLDERGAVEVKKNWELREKYRAKFVGVDDRNTEVSRKIMSKVMRWSNVKNPYYKGYPGLCELWCADTYRAAGLPYNGQCCATKHSLFARHDGPVPKGALIFSGVKPDGTMYENNHNARAICNVCGEWAGHVGIYVGNGLVAGAQVPFLWQIDSWIATFGYGGWSMS